MASIGSSISSCRRKLRRTSLSFPTKRLRRQPPRASLSEPFGRQGWRMNVNHEMLILAREAKGIVQGEFAHLLGVSQGTVSRWETGVLDPTSEVIEQYSRHLGVTPEFFQRSDRVYGFNSTVFFHRRRESGTDRALRKLHAC